MRPPRPFFGHKVSLGEGCVHFEAPPRQEFHMPPSFIYTPIPRRVISGVRGLGCIEFGPPILNAIRHKSMSDQRNGFLMYLRTAVHG